MHFLAAAKAAFFGRLALDEIVKKHAHIFRLGNNQLDFIDGCILEHLRERNILAQLALQVESVAFGSNQLNAALAVVQNLKEFLGLTDVLNFHRFPTSLFYLAYSMPL